MSEATTHDVPYLSSVEIERRAREVRERHDQDRIPVKLLPIARKEGIAVMEGTFGRATTVGMIEKKGDQVTIIVKRGAPPLRTRFTIAHELGHYFLHLRDKAKLVDHEVNLYRLQASPDVQETGRRRREIQANLFAAALLMPERQVRKIWKETQSIAEMASLFRVSPGAMGYRIADLGID
jgi:Zn-dependent peptidase ImmA (M78 family)